MVVGMSGRSDRDAPPLRKLLEHRALNGPIRYQVKRDRLNHATRILDLSGTFDAAAIRNEFDRFGSIHVRNTGIQVKTAGDLSPEILESIGFGTDQLFEWGGLNCGRTQRLALSRELRATDNYPKHLWLLPHNEVLYQRRIPQRLLFFSATACDGRTFTHSAKLLRERLESRPEGSALVDEFRTHGLRIEMGFIDEHHPDRAKNYFRSWQERFDTNDRERAERLCRASTHQFDECW